MRCCYWSMRHPKRNNRMCVFSCFCSFRCVVGIFPSLSLSFVVQAAERCERYGILMPYSLYYTSFGVCMFHAFKLVWQWFAHVQVRCSNVFGSKSLSVSSDEFIFFVRSLLFHFGGFDATYKRMSRHCKRAERALVLLSVPVHCTYS